MSQRGMQIKAGIGGLILIVALLSWHEAQAGPITCAVGTPPCPNSGPYTKLGVYQGVISVVPGGASDSVLEIGNAGRDIASTGSINLRPGNNGGQAGDVVVAAQATPNEGGEVVLLGAGTFQNWYTDVFQSRYRIHTNGIERFVIDGTAGGNVYIPTGSLCFGNVGSTNCVSSGSGSTPPLDLVLATGNSGNAKTILLTNQVPNAQSFGATSTGSIGTGSFAFLAPNLNSGSYNDVTRAGDSGMFFSTNGAFTIGGWNSAGVIKAIRLSGPNAGLPVGYAALAVNNGLSGTGSGGDAIAAFANSDKSSVYAQQTGTGYGVYVSLPSTTTTSAAVYAESNSANGWAGYFDGRVYSSNSVTASTFVLGTVAKSTWTVQVCLIGGACLGQYLGSTGTSILDFRYYYNTVPNTISSVLIYSGALVQYCNSGSHLVARSTTTGNSKYDTSGCTGTEYTLGGGSPYGSGNACQADVGGTVEFQSVRSSAGCVNQILEKPSMYRITAALTGPAPQYELR